MAEPDPSKVTRALRLTTLYVVGLFADFGLGRVGAWLDHLAAVTRWEKGTTFFYAESAQRLFAQAHGAFATVLYLSLVGTLLAAFARPLAERRRFRRKTRGRLSEAARAHPVAAERVLPWAAGFSWLGLSVFGVSLVEFVARLGFGWHVPIAVNERYLLSGLAYDLVRASNPGFLLGSVLAVVGVAAATRHGVRKLTRDPEAPEPVAATSIDDQGSFAAVAVTASTQGAVAALTAVSIAVATFAVEARSNALLAPVVFAYVLAALGTATLFRRMSRIAVGIDGVLVLGADRTRFFAYADLDDVKANGSDILLQRRGKTALRLQLHDEDVTRASALAGRIRATMADATRMRGEGADRLMQTMEHASWAAGRGREAGGAPSVASARLASASRGGLDYRQPAIAREQLWQLVEGPVSDANARRVAAEALAPDMSRDEKARLRVVAEKCAEPRARIALERLLASEDEELPVEAPAIVPRRRFSQS